MKGYEREEGGTLREASGVEVFRAWSPLLKREVVVKSYARSEVSECECLVKEAIRQAQAGCVHNCRLRDLTFAREDPARALYTANFIYEKLERKVDPELVMSDESSGQASAGLSEYRVGKLLAKNPSTLMEVHEAWSERLQLPVIIKSFMAFDISEATSNIREALVQATVSARCQKNCKLIDVAIESLGVGRRELKIHIIMEKMNCDLTQELAERRNSCFTEEELLRVLIDVTEGLAHAKSLGVAHRDIKPENILLAPNGGYKVADFGTAWVQMHSLRATTTAGTLPYLSPELKLSFFRSAADYDPFKSDIYSLGITILHLAKLQYPNTLDKTEEGALAAAVEAELEDLPYSDELKDLIRKMLRFNPDRRLNLELLQAEARAMLAGPIRRKPAKTASVQQEICGVCKTSYAIAFCLCREVPLCRNCVGAHASSRQHSTHPMQAYPFRKVPGYFERLQSRAVRVPAACEELRSNLQVISKCIEELTHKGEAIVLAVREYVKTETEKLQQLRTHLEREIDEAVAEVEKTLYEEEPQLRSQLGRLLRSEASQLSIFEHRFFVKEVSVKMLLKCAYSCGGIVPADEDLQMPLLVKHQLTCYGLRTAETSRATVCGKMPKKTRFCLLDSDTVLCAGSSPASTMSCLLSLFYATVTPQQPMATPRFSPGMLKLGNFAYVFGGFDGKQSLTASEKFSISTLAWLPLPDMLNARESFCPCALGEDIYLADVGRAHRALEVFSTRTEEMRQLETRLPEALAGFSVAFMAEGELYILTKQSQLARWKVKAEASFRVASVKMQSSSGGSSIEPIRVGRDFFWTRFSDSALIKFNLDTQTVLISFA